MHCQCKKFIQQVDYTEFDVTISKIFCACAVKKLQITCYLSVNVMRKVCKADRLLYKVQWL